MSQPENPPLFEFEADHCQARTKVTLRDLFAAFAMLGLVQDQAKVGELCEESGAHAIDMVPLMAYGMADAMLKERGRQN